MSGPGKEDERPKLERFDGSQPSSYRRWRHKAELMLLALPNTYTKDRWGAKLLEYISGEAEEVCEHVPLSDLVKEKGHELIFKALDERYKELDKEALHNRLNAYFYGTSIRSGETFRNMTVRLDSAYRRLQEHSVELPSEVRGWFLLRKLQLDQSSEAMVLTKGSLKYEDVNKAIQSIFPQGSAKTGAKIKEVYEADVASTVNENENEETIDEVFQAVADQVQAAEDYDDEDALEVFETYKENDAMVAEGSSSGPDHLGGEYFIDPDEIEGLEIFLAERDGEVDVVVASKEESLGEQGEVKGDFEQDLMKFFKLSGQSNDLSDSEAYIAACAGLADHGVPDTACRRLVLSAQIVPTHRSRMSYTGAMQLDAPMEEFIRTPLINELLEEVAGSSVEDQMSEIHCKILDEAPDHNEDEPEGIVPGVEGQLGRFIFNVGKYQKAGALVNFRSTYETDKKYVAWIRKFIKRKADTVSGKGSQPTMVLFRLYVALRDQKNSGNTWGADSGGRVASGIVSDTGGLGGSSCGSQDPCEAKKAKPQTARRQGYQGHPAARQVQAAPRQPARVAQQQMVPAEEGSLWENEWTVTQEEATPVTMSQEMRRIQTPDRSNHTPARGAGGGSRDLDDATATTAVMTKAEKKLCRRGIAAVRQERDVCDSGGYGVDVLMLQHDPDEHILTAVGLSSSSVFDDVQPCDLRRTTTVNEVLTKVRKLRPRMLMIRTPDHMTRTKGGPHIVRTYTARHRVSFTKLAVACCAEQLCEGRLFCIEEVNDSTMSERVREWKRMMGDDRVMCVQRHDDDSSWRMYTNSRHVRDESKKCWLNQREWRDPRGFIKDMAAGVLRDRQGVHEVHVAHCVYAVEELRRETGVDERKVMTILRRCHENLGHPSPARMNMLLKAAHASERVLQLARSLECETCAALSKPKSHNVTKMRRATEFNQQVCVDTFELDVRNDKMHFLNIVDEATGYQMCVPLWKGMQAKVVRNAYRKGWKRWAGAPVRLFSDGGKELEGEFEHGLSLDGTYGDTSAAYAPWQNGTAERKDDVWKTAFAKAQLEVRPRSKQEVQELIDQINTAVNSVSRKDGYSPHQHVFGKDVRIPGMITSDADPVISSSLAQGESVFERRMNMRTAARKAFLDADGDARIRKAMEHRSRPERGPFEEGQLVYFWRRNRFENRHHWHGPAVVIGKNGRSKVWVAKGTKVYRCCPEQLRRLSPDQEAMVKLLPEDMVHVHDNVSARGAGNYHDISGLEVPPDVTSTDGGDERQGGEAEVPWAVVQSWSWKRNQLSQLSVRWNQETCLEKVKMAQNAQQRQFQELMTNLGQATEALARVAAQTAQQQEQLTQAMNRVNEGQAQGAEGPAQPPPQGTAVPFDAGGKVLKAPDTFSPNTTEEEVSQWGDWSFGFRNFLSFMDWGYLTDLKMAEQRTAPIDSSDINGDFFEGPIPMEVWKSIGCTAIEEEIRKAKEIRKEKEQEKVTTKEKEKDMVDMAEDVAEKVENKGYGGKGKSDGKGKGKKGKIRNVREDEESDSWNESNQHDHLQGNAIHTTEQKMNITFEFRKDNGKKICVMDSAVFGNVTQPLFAVGKLWKCGWGIEPKDSQSAYLKKGKTMVPIRFVNNSTVTDLRIYRAEARESGYEKERMIRKLTIKKEIEEDLEQMKYEEGWMFLRSGKPVRIDWDAKYTYNPRKDDVKAFPYRTTLLTTYEEDEVKWIELEFFECGEEWSGRARMEITASKRWNVVVTIMEREPCGMEAYGKYVNPFTTSIEEEKSAKKKSDEERDREEVMKDLDAMESGEKIPDDDDRTTYDEKEEKRKQVEEKLPSIGESMEEKMIVGGIELTPERTRGEDNAKDPKDTLAISLVMVDQEEMVKQMSISLVMVLDLMKQDLILRQAKIAEVKEMMMTTMKILAKVKIHLKHPQSGIWKVKLKNLYHIDEEVELDELDELETAVGSENETAEYMSDGEEEVPEEIPKWSHAVEDGPPKLDEGELEKVDGISRQKEIERLTEMKVLKEMPEGTDVSKYRSTSFCRLKLYMIADTEKVNGEEEEDL
ncbi:unnamed protein product [Symbiodinium sp. KB8]|nr:unnamed protein product [Symbiodinium sp. KB8]